MARMYYGGGHHYSTRADMSSAYVIGASMSEPPHDETLLPYRRDLGRAHLARVAQMVKANGARAPAHRGLCGADSGDVPCYTVGCDAIIAGWNAIDAASERPMFSGSYTETVSV